jgi:hypothetical protein
MSAVFQPQLSILDDSQRRLWDELTDVPPEFVLYGGTAVALHLGHRKSVDFDFFSSAGFDPDLLYQTVTFLAGSKVLRQSTNTLTCLLERGGNIQISFFGVPHVTRLSAPLIAVENNLKVASLLDLAGVKSAVVQKRAEAKDYLDLDAILHQGNISLSTALAAGMAIYGSPFNPELTLKSLAFFEDGNLSELPREVRDRLAAAVKSVDLDRLPQLSADSGTD